MAPSHLTRGAWIEIMILSIDSLPDSGRTRGAWIEILQQYGTDFLYCDVAPHTRCVD